MQIFQKEKMFFAEHLSLMLKGGVSLSEALEILRDESKSKSFRNVLDNVLENILDGETLNKSLGNHPKVFDNFFQSVVRVGEKSGTLEENLKYLSVCLKKTYSLKRKIIGALIYPFLVLITGLVIVSLITIFILPRLFVLFGALQIELPLPTKILLGTGAFLKENIVIIFMGILFLFFIYKVLCSILSVRLFFGRIILSLPLFGAINKNHNLARFSRIFYTLFKAGMPLLDSLDICVETIPNQVYKKHIYAVREGVEKGEKISENLKRFSEAFPVIFSQMVLVGEETGSLEESMLYLANFYEQEVDSTLKDISVILEPFLLILVGIFVVFLILAIITPIYQFTSGFGVR